MTKLGRGQGWCSGGGGAPHNTYQGFSRTVWQVPLAMVISYAIALLSWLNTKQMPRSPEHQYDAFDYESKAGFLLIEGELQ